MAGFDFSIALQMLLFLFSMWFSGRAFQRFGLPPIIGQIGVGLLFGKEVLDFVPYATNGKCDSIANPQLLRHRPRAPSEKLFDRVLGLGRVHLLEASRHAERDDRHKEKAAFQIFRQQQYAESDGREDGRRKKGSDQGCQQAYPTKKGSSLSFRT